MPALNPFVLSRRSLVLAASAWPLAVRAQQRSIPLVGYLHSGSAAPLAREVTAFRQGLREAGYVEGQNLAIEFRWAEDQFDRLPALAADLVQRQVAVIAAIGGNSAKAAKAATSTIPIVFQIGSDPIKAGLVTSLSHPGANLTGFSIFVGASSAKRLELLHELVPAANRIGVLLNPLAFEAELRLKELQNVSPGMQLQLLPITVIGEEEFDAAFATIAASKANGLFVFGSPFFDSNRERIVTLAAQHTIPATYPWREYVAAGGLMSYGTSLIGASRQTGAYVARVLNGEKPGDLPVQQPTRFQLVINLKTAKSLGLPVPLTLLAQADEVIE